MFSNITKTLKMTLKNRSDDVTDDEVSTKILISAGFIIIPMILLAVVGNALTISCFIRDKGLHKTCNVYILNLAVSDLLIGAVIMPIYLTYTFSNNVWHFGYHFCKVYLLLDMVTCGVTVILMILISYDRLTLLRHWTTYHKTNTSKKAYIKCALSWIALFAINCPATIGWDIWTGENISRPDDCIAQYQHNIYYVSIMATIQFLIPLIVLCVIHTLIVREIRELNQARELLINYDSRCDSQDLSSSAIHLELKETSQLKRHSQHTTDNHHTSKGTKAAKALAILTIVFFVTWAPYGIMIVVQSICPECVNPLVEETFTYILWFKSAVNPFLYAFNSNRFRENFKYFLCCRRHKYKPPAVSR